MTIFKDRCGGRLEEGDIDAVQHALQYADGDGDLLNRLRPMYPAVELYRGSTHLRVMLDGDRQGGRSIYAETLVRVLDRDPQSEEGEEVLTALADASGDAYDRLGQEKPDYLKAAQEQHQRYPTLSREPLDLFMLHHELAARLGSTSEAWQVQGLFARYLDTVLLDIVDQKQYREEWDYDRMRGLILTLANDLEGRESELNV